MEPTRGIPNQSHDHLRNLEPNVAEKALQGGSSIRLAIPLPFALSKTGKYPNRAHESFAEQIALKVH
jgi:hypothetical protein